VFITLYTVEQKYDMHLVGKVIDADHQNCGLIIQENEVPKYGEHLLQFEIEDS
jgi:hypothetical protein